MEMKRIYTAIENAVEDAGAMRIVVTSASADEGKSLVSAGLAGLASLQGGKRVLAIDLNWFRPALHTFFDLERTYDVDALQNGAKVSDLIQPSGVDGLEILTAPVLDQTAEESFPTWNALGKKILGQARDGHDSLIIDACPMFPTNRRMIDPVAFSGIVDGVVLVTMAHVTHR
ncbi:MAG: CpsD/CapB family tyrosine-protein kinase, partial [Desulfobacterales bacterium]|nr:CpsD/CapB family tyrosine-protein kinase [Desulfobacterales bacterium]